MRDSQIISAVKQVLDDRLPQVGLTGVIVAQSFQPTQQGVPEGRILYLHKITEKKHGYPGQKHVYNESSENFDSTTTFISETSWQITARAQQSPADVDPTTASDLANAASDILQLQSVRIELQNLGIRIHRITSVRTLYEENEKDRYEQVPSFDFTVNHESSIIETTRSVSEIQPNIHEVL